MPTATNYLKAIDPGIVTLGLFLRVHRVVTKVEQIRQRRTANIGIPALLNWAKKLGIIARIEPAGWERLAAVQLPANRVEVAMQPPEIDPAKPDDSGLGALVILRAHDN
jgi:hypothetical protein